MMKTTPDKFKNIDKNEALVSLEKKILEVVKDFNWDLFYEILDAHEKKSGRKFSAKERIADELSNKRKTVLHKNFSNSPDSLDGTTSKFRPNIRIDYSINAIATSTSLSSIISTKTSEIRFNPTYIFKFLESVKNRMKERNIVLSPKSSIEKIIIIKVFFHELMHLVGGIKSSHATIRSFNKYSSIMEPVTELLSFKMMTEYLFASGDSLSNDIIKFYYQGGFGVYEPEKNLFFKLILILTEYEGQDLKTFIDAFYWAHFNGYDVSSEEFLNLLPNNFVEVWIKFLKLKFENGKQFSEDYKQITKDIEEIIKKMKEGL